MDVIQPNSIEQAAEDILVDRFGRQVTYLRLSVTDRCNFRCVYCMDEEMEFLPRSRILSIEEMAKIASAFSTLGVSKIRLTGGEPLVRKGIVELCQQISSLARIKELAITTNGALLNQYAKPLADAGVNRLNISLDSLQPDRFKQMTRTGDLAEVLSGIDAASEAGFAGIKINAVVMRGTNEDETIDLARFALERDFDISFIEEMPLGDVSSHSREETQYQSNWIRSELETEFDLESISDNTGGPSRYFKAEGFSGRVGFISPMSDNFCASCNRVRLTTEGRLLLCLGNEHSVDLKTVLRDNPNQMEPLISAIKNSMNIKPERHHFDSSNVEIVRFMNMTGG